jgi:hypothetical protein
MTTILEQVLEATALPRQQGTRLAAQALKTARSGPQWIASRMQRARVPVSQLARSGHRLNDRAHRLVGRLLDRNAAALETVMALGATRMQTTAEMMTTYAETLHPPVHPKRRRVPARTAARRAPRKA